MYDATSWSRPGDKRGANPSSPFASPNSFRSIFEAVNDGIFICDPDTGRFIEVNQRGCDMFGHSKIEIVGSGIGFLSSGIHPYTLETAFERMDAARKQGPQSFEWQCKAKDGTLFWSDISIRYTKIGRAPAIVAIARDITENKRLDEELRLALSRASAANEAKSAFLASMSHELRTPLNAIIGFSDLMLTQKFGPLGSQRYREYLGDILGSGRHLLSLIDDLLDLSRIDAGRANMIEKDISLCDVVVTACRQVEEQARQAKLEILIDLPAGLPELRGDERRIKQIVLNLLSNAVKFTPAGGTVTIAARCAPKGLQLEVVDTGIGIAEADLPKVLERFGQVDSTHSRKHKGTGLGLPLVKELIELHGGCLSVASKSGKGTKVTVTFPSERIVMPTVSAAA